MRVNNLDVLIFGGGIAGLWLLNRLRTAGYHAHLLEQEKLGAGQSIASQGVIHGGIKNALGNVAAAASTTFTNMPAHWQKCLQGNGEVDLRGCKVLSEHFYMWPRGGLRSRLNAFLGSSLLASQVAKVSAGDYPACFRGHISGPLYRIQDLVLDIPSLLQTLSGGQKDYIHQIDWECSALQRDQASGIASIKVNGQVEIRARCHILCGGGDSAAWQEKFDLPAMPMQLRPLQMVMVKHRIPHPLFVHCLSDQLTTNPEFIITTHRCRDDSWVWYLGGGIAEQGATLPKDELIAQAREKMKSLFPWHDLDQASWHAFAINRVEGMQQGGLRPSDVSVSSHGNLMTCNPNKLTLAPRLAEQVMRQLQQQGINPSPGQEQADLSMLPRPGIAAPPWDKL